MEDVISIAQESIGALSACIGEEKEEEIRCRREKLDTLLRKMCGHAHSIEPPLPTRTMSAPPSIQDDVIILSDSDDNDNTAQRDQGWLLTTTLTATHVCGPIVSFRTTMQLVRCRLTPSDARLQCNMHVIRKCKFLIWLKFIDYNSISERILVTQPRLESPIYALSQSFNQLNHSTRDDHSPSFTLCTHVLTTDLLHAAAQTHAFEVCVKCDVHNSGLCRRAMYMQQLLLNVCA